MPTHFMLVCVGTDGDVLPFLGLAQLLRARQHDVTVVSHHRYARRARSAGAQFWPLSGEVQDDQSLRDMVILNTRYTSLYIYRHVVEWNVEVLRAARKLSGVHSVLVSGERGLLWADFMAQRHLGVPVIRGLVDPPLIVRPPAESGQLPISGVQRELGWRLDRRWRSATKSLGIPVGVEQMPRLARLAQREAPKFGLWPAWLLGDSASSLPIPAMGFVSFQGGDATKPPAFCLPEDGKKRVVFVAGSAGTRNWWTSNFAQISAEACRKLGCSGLILGATSSTDVECLAEGVFTTACFPLAAALRKAGAIVHHGGIGTAAAAMRQGVPQLIVPRMFSQPSNAEWLRRLGVAVVLDPREYVLERVVETLAGILSGSTLRPRALQLMERSSQEMEGERLCNFIETWSVRAREKRALGGT